MTRNWMIVFANSVPAEERSRFAGELAERLKAVLDATDWQENGGELRFSEGALPFNLQNVVAVIPHTKICTVMLDNRYDSTLEPSATTGVQLTQTKGGRFEVELSNDPKIAEAQVRDFDNFVSWTK